MKKHLDVVGAAIVRGGTVLAAQRGPGMTLPGMWEFPGGKIEPGETPEQALLRELREELRCGVAVGALVETTTHESETVVVTLAVYRARLVHGEPQAVEHADLRWVPLTELDALDWAPADVPAVRRLMRDPG